MGKKLVWQGIHFRVFHEEVNFPDGSSRTFEHVWRRDGTRVLAIDDQNNILLTREYRHELKGHDWKLPGGKLNHENELPEVAARREFAEETGYTATNFEYLGSSIPFATIQYRIHFFLATSLSKEFNQNTELGEEIDVHWKSLEEGYQMAISGQIREEISALQIIKYYHGLLQT